MEGEDGMFDVIGRRIVLSPGDTGVVSFVPEDMQVGEGDRAVFTVSGRGGRLMLEKVAAPEGNVFHVPFLSGDTDSWRAGEYLWDIRVVRSAVVDEGGRVTDGAEVITPFPPSPLVIAKAVGRV